MEILSKNNFERKTQTVESFTQSADFNKLSEAGQRTARLVLLYGGPSEHEAVMQEKRRTNFLGFSFVGFHELGHKLAALEVGGQDVKAKILGPGEGVTTWRHSFKNSLSQFFLERMFVGFAGRKAVEVLGFDSKGHGSDMGQIEYQAKLYQQFTGRSGNGLKNQAESWAESFVSHNQNRILKEGFQEALAA